MWGFPVGSDDKASASNTGYLGSIPALGRFPGEENGNPVQYSGLENSMEGGALAGYSPGGSQRVGHDQATLLSFSLYRSKAIKSFTGKHIDIYVYIHMYFFFKNTGCICKMLLGRYFNIHFAIIRSIFSNDFFM